MRTDPSEPSPSISNRWRSRAAESVSRFSGMPALGRLGMFALMAAVAAVIGYGILSLNTAEDSSRREWLFAGNRFSQDDVAKITKILEDAQLAPITDGGRIGVPRSRMAEARSMLSNAGLAPRRMADIHDDPDSFASVLRPPSAQQKLRDEQQAERLTLAIDRLNPELGASVQINRKQSGGFGRPSELVEVHVYLDVESGQKIKSQQVEAIKNLMISLEPDLKPEGLHLVDRMGNVYLSPTNPSLGHRSRAKAREEELADKIATTLNWIRDLRVTVTIDPESVPAAPPAEAQVVETIPQPISANQPLEAEPSETPEPVVALPAEGDGGDTARLGQATVFIQVPVSYVVSRFNAIHGTSRRPAREDLAPIFRQTREDVIDRVRNIVPEAELAHVEVDKFDTEVQPVAEIPAAPSRLTLRSWWVPAALSGAVAALALAAFGGWWAARRPANRPRPVAAQRPPRWTVATPSSPSERVRELIRIDPAAAAGVLHRWIGQSTGGPDA